MSTSVRGAAASGEGSSLAARRGTPPEAAHSPAVRWTETPGFPAPIAPRRMRETGVDVQVLTGLMIKTAATVPSFTTQWAIQKLRLSVQIVEELCWQMKDEKLLDIVEQKGPYNYVYTATQRCREFAKNLMDISGYVGPAPVSLETYVDALERQYEAFRPATETEIRDALQDMVLSDEAVETASLAAISGRSLFAFGPAGNGKTTLGRCLQSTLYGDLWIPHCINIEHNIIRLFDEQVHQMIDPQDQTNADIDQRWLRVRRPFVVSGGEMTLEEMDLVWTPSYRFYEAPPHLKANGGIFMIDDFGRQRIAPHELLNRWIVPLENRIDHLALVNGQKIEVPFKVMLVIATNLSVKQVADPAFLRRMGYRLYVEKPTPENYAKIFHRYAEKHGVTVADGAIDGVIRRYHAEGRELRGSEPRDLLERVKDVCRLRNLSLVADQSTLEIAWRGYFGNSEG